MKEEGGLKLQENKGLLYTQERPDLHLIFQVLTHF